MAERKGQFVPVLPSPSDPPLAAAAEIGNRAESAAEVFTAEKHPFLFPLNLLDGSSPRVIPAAAAANAPAEVDRTASGAAAWWLLHTKPQQEKKLAAELRRLQISHFLPVTPWKAVTRGRTRVTWAPLFPGYVFLFGTDESRLHALKTNRLVADHRVADKLQLHRQLWDLADLIEKDVPLRREERLAVGQQVRVKSGILKDKCGVVMKQGGKARLFIQVVDFLGGVSVEIEQHLVEPYS